MQAEIARFERYLKQRYPGRSTSKHYMSDLTIFQQFAGDVSPQIITSKVISAFVETQSTQGLKAATINRRLSAISSFFDFLMFEAEDDTWSNPVQWKHHSIRPGRHLPRDVSDETVDQLMAVIDDARDRAIFTLMVGAGLRVGEVVNLQLDDLHPPETTQLVRLRVRGKGDKERIVWLTLEVMHPIDQWLQERPPADSPCLFLNQHRRPLSVAGIQFRLKQYCQHAGVKLSCHQLRHTFARRLAEHQMPIDSLAKLLGHTDLRTTQRYIDGADPTVRNDFLYAMQHLNPVVPRAPEPLTDGATTPAFATPQPDPRPDPVALVDALAHLAGELPVWLQQELRQHTIRRIARWQPHRAKAHTHTHFSTLCRVSRWLVTQRHWPQLEQLQRADLVAYVNARQETGIKPGSIAAELTIFRAFWRDLLAEDKVTNGAVLQVKAPATGDHLPRYLTGPQFQQVEQIMLTETQALRPQDRFNRAWFYLFAHAGLRLSEALNLRVSDCDLSGGRLRVQAGKGDRDRVIPMTPHLVTVLQEYLVAREPAETDHLLLYNGAPVKNHLLPDRLRAFGRKVDIVPLTPHRLRHTLATLLINQGMPITSLQKFLGHQDINKTLIYARVYDETVRTQFVSAMAQIESIAVVDWPITTPVTIPSITKTCDSV
ncbi:MAG: tyrosine-type recombinase/integrase [Chloroflexi bacterium]|nr:tyrosine-type recombinase/integrase [Chloroflexota bacterium]